MTERTRPSRVGELRPNQLLHSFGVGAVVDLPNLSVMVMGIDDWDAGRAREIGEARLVAAVRNALGAQGEHVERLLTPPAIDEGLVPNPLDESYGIGVPVAPFPRWLRCPWCNLIAPISSELFTYKPDPYRTDRCRYVHTSCSKARKPPTVVPARFLVACEHGHLDDFPWIHYAHRGPTTCRAVLRLREMGVSGATRDILVSCDTCRAPVRNMADAFGDDSPTSLPSCTGRRPHLRDREERTCAARVQAILLGASNSWFPIMLSSLTVPAQEDRLAQLVEQHWAVLEKATSLTVLAAFRAIGQLRPFADHSDEELWKAIEGRRAAVPEAPAAGDLKGPEWRNFSRPDAAPASGDFQLTAVGVPAGYERWIERVVLAERLREVRALIGFTRIDSPGDFMDVGDLPEERRAPLARRPPTWVPAAEVRGEGIFIQFHEELVLSYCQSQRKLDAAFFDAHCRWRRVRRIEPVDGAFPGLRYVLIHSFAHAFMRQVALECGYTAASIRERIYALGPDQDGGPMAGVLIYTAAPDSEGTLGGLVGLGRPDVLGRHLDQALEQMKLCTSDPLCAEHLPSKEGVSLHGGSCHACLFAPETSCERGNRYLDRNVLVQTMRGDGGAFFDVAPPGPR